MANSLQAIAFEKIKKIEFLYFYAFKKILSTCVLYIFRRVNTRLAVVLCGCETGVFLMWNWLNYKCSKVFEYIGSRRERIKSERIYPTTRATLTFRRANGLSNCVTKWNKTPFAKKLIVCSGSHIFPPFVESEGSSPCSQDPATGFYPQPDESCQKLRDISP
jgi:hypothetical protein